MNFWRWRASDEAAEFFGPNLELRAFKWDETAQKWKDHWYYYG